MKTKALLLTLCAFSLFTRAQITGQHTYDHGGNPAILSAGTYVNSNPGFVMAGYVPTTVAGAANFFVDKTDPRGTFSGGFSNEYLFSTFCHRNQWIQELNCYGLSLIETSAGGYAFTAAFDSGCLFGFLTAAGGLGINDHFAFPAGAMNISKPVITESTSSPGEFYVCGSYFDPDNNIWRIYAFKFDTAGSIPWNEQYDLNSPNMLVPYGVVEGNYNGLQELAVAGTVYNASSAEDCFFMLLDGGTGGVNLYEEIDLWGPGTGAIDYCTSIALSTPNNGYIIGGSSVSPPGAYSIFFVQLNSNGTCNWGLSPTWTYPSTEVVDIEERFSTFYNNWEYYGAVRSSNGMLVMKIRDNAIYWPGNAQLYYASNLGAVANSISLDKVTTSSNYGLHVFGTSANGDFVLNQACFNGATANCPSTGSQELLSFTGAIQWSNNPQTLSINMSPGLGRCVETNQIVVNPINYPVNTICFQSSGLPAAPYTGSNNRTAEITGISGPEPENQLLSVYPNPVINNATIHYQLDDNCTVKVELYNNLGQLITTLEEADKGAGVHTVALDMKGLGVETGVYFVKVHCNGGTHLEKLVYSGN